MILAVFEHFVLLLILFSCVSTGAAQSPGTFTANEIEMDHTGSFFPVLATITVSP